MERVRLGSRCWGMPELPVWRSLSFPTGMELAQGEKGDGEHSRPLFIEPLELYHVFSERVPAPCLSSSTWRPCFFLMSWLS